MTDLMDYLELLESMGLNQEAMMAVGIMLGVGLLLSGLVSLLLYIFKAAGMHTIAKRRGIAHAWLAWVPVAHYWVAGSLSDHYRKTVNGKESSHRTIMLVLAIVAAVISLIINSMSLGVLVEAFEYLADGDLQGLTYMGTMATGSTGLLGYLAEGVDLALTVFWFIALYHIYSSVSPDHKVVFLVLSIFFPITQPFFLFYNRNKDAGMQKPQTTEEIPPVEGTVEYL